MTGPPPHSARHCYTLLLTSTPRLPTLGELQSRPFWGKTGWCFFWLSCSSNCLISVRCQNWTLLTDINRPRQQHVKISRETRFSFHSYDRLGFLGFSIQRSEPTKDGLVVAMIHLAFGPCKRDLGQNTLHYWSVTSGDSVAKYCFQESC